MNWFKTQELKDWYLDSSAEKITPEAVRGSSAKVLPAGTILMAMYGDGKTITSLGILRSQAACNQACCALIVNPEICNPLFLFYALKYHRNSFIRLATGGAQRNLSGTLIRNFAISIPPLPEQHAIAHILGTLDDKIELNRRMNETLEAMGRALFTSWFVDFDPVRAKADGRQPAGMDTETTVLFPDGFEESELGEVPREWVVKPLDAVAQFTNGLALQRYPPDETGFLPVIKIAELHRGITAASDRASASIDRRYVVHDGDVLFSWSGSLEACVWCGGTGALNQHLFKVTSDHYPKWFYYQWVCQHLPEFRAIASDKATTMGHIQRYHLTEAKVLVPPRSLMTAMSRLQSPLLERQVANAVEARTLSTIRDTLLPKLLSGDMRVQDAEKVVEEVMA